MKVSQKKVDGDKVTLSAIASKDDVAKALQMAQEGFARSMGLKPDSSMTIAQAAEQHLGIKDLDSIVAGNAIELLIPMALDKRNIAPSFMPKPQTTDVLRRGAEFKFTLEVTLKPAYELTSYDPIDIEIMPFGVSEEEVEAELEKMAGSFTAYVKDDSADPERPVQSGDYIKVFLEATQDGERLKGLSTDGRTYVVGAGHMPQGFDEQVTGMKVGEEKEFDFAAPGPDPEAPAILTSSEADPPSEDGAGKEPSPIHAKVKVLELQREEKPELDDAWVKVHVPFFNSAQEMRDNVRKSLEMQARESYDAYLRQLAAAELAKRFEGKISDKVYESMMSQLQSNIRMDLKQQGKTWEQFVEENGGEQQLTMLLMMQAREVITQGYALDAVYRHFKLTISTSDVEAVCHAMNPNGDPREMRQQAERAGQGSAIREMAERFKANQYILDHANITYIEEQR